VDLQWGSSILESDSESVYADVEDCASFTLGGSDEVEKEAFCFDGSELTASMRTNTYYSYAVPVRLD
jgi:hypothetical protein